MASKASGEVVLGLRVPREWLKMADALVPRLRHTDIRAAGKVLRSTVLRLALKRGLDALEAEYK